VGACIDSGNPLWAIEDPHVTLETLHPYVAHEPHSRQPSGACREGGGRGCGCAWAKATSHSDYVRNVLRVVSAGPSGVARDYRDWGPRGVPRILIRQFWEGVPHDAGVEFSPILALGVERGKPIPAQPPVPREQAAQREPKTSKPACGYTKNCSP